LFRKVPDDLAVRLFSAYADVYKAEKAKEFWTAAQKEEDSDLEVLRGVTVSAEINQQLRHAKTKKPKETKIWADRETRYVKDLPRRKWTLAPSKEALAYVVRLMATDSADEHLIWMHKLAQTWAAKDQKFLCDMEYPVLSRIYEK